MKHQGETCFIRTRANGASWYIQQRLYTHIYGSFSKAVYQKWDILCQTSKMADIISALQQFLSWVYDNSGAGLEVGIQWSRNLQRCTGIALNLIFINPGLTCLMVQGRWVYMVEYGPLVYGNWPGISFGISDTSSFVYTGLIFMP